MDIRSITLFLFYFIMFYISRLEGYTLLFTRILVPIFFLYSMFYRGRFRPVFNTQIVLFILFIVWSISGLIIAVHEPSFYRALQRTVGGLLGLFITVNVLRSLKDFKIVAMAIAIGVFIGSIDSLTQIGGNYSERLSGIYNNPNFLASICLSGLVFSFIWLDLSKVKFKNLYQAGMSGFFALPIVLSASRKGLLSYFLFLTLYFVFTLNIKRKIKFVFSGLSLVIVLLFTNFDYISNIFDKLIILDRIETSHISNSSDVRRNLVAEAISTGIENPFFGVGLGQFRYYNNYRLMSHNDFAEAFASTGIGSIFYILVVFSLIVKYKKRKNYLHWINSKYGNQIYPLLKTILPFLLTYIALGMGKPHSDDIFYMSIIGYFAAVLSNTNSKYFLNSSSSR